ncbi:MAG TPA: ABC transporter permease [Candidatus Paceibacterota bacterium]
MRFKFTYKTAFTSLRGRMSRSLLTILGIVIGIAAIMMVSAAGKGAENLITSELSGLGGETVVVQPGKEPKGPSDFAQSLLSDSLKDRELEAISRKANVPDLIDISPEIFVSGGASYQGETVSATVLGFSAEFMMENMGLKLAEGVNFDDADIGSKSAVAVIGSDVREELFGTEEALGKYLTIKNKRFRVVGTYAPQGQAVFFNVDDLIVVPYSTAQTYLTGEGHYSQFVVRASSVDVVDRMAADITRTLRDLHNITDPEEDDFHVETQQGLVDQISTIIGAFTLFLSFVVTIALVVGGVGVMNIMLVSVTERTREIGLRKALGATDRDILLQFLTEAVMLTGAGGVIGVVLGSLFSYVAAIAVRQFAGLDWGFVFPYMGAFAGIIVSVLVGLVFGIYPARVASRKSPIEALRYE